ncbi:MAG: DUF2283 domain-containing protein [Candidatus Dormibacteraceae bacterium]
MRHIKPLKYTFDAEADALYIYLSDRPYASGYDLDPERRIDFDSAGKPIGVELLCVKDGVNLEGLPDNDRINRLLGDIKIKAVA